MRGLLWARKLTDMITHLESRANLEEATCTKVQSLIRSGLRHRLAGACQNALRLVHLYRHGCMANTFVKPE